ncbi:hypothetical protein SKAU_G00088960 [Synaphobranchus kaupii]|uniref:Uncharacterized protein n=1 Tax=Synaphobranchus kaupii TaxID=118154 RepID=A0A9Q1J6A9_SYNKA|nr:hypothetical protein SKAU_G00088960 [Synaphobranchus kaupii]
MELARKGDVSGKGGGPQGQHLALARRSTACRGHAALRLTHLWWDRVERKAGSRAASISADSPATGAVGKAPFRSPPGRAYRARRWSGEGNGVRRGSLVARSGIGLLNNIERQAQMSGVFLQRFPVSAFPLLSSHPARYSHLGNL